MHPVTYPSSENRFPSESIPLRAILLVKPNPSNSQNLPLGRFSFRDIGERHPQIKHLSLNHKCRQWRICWWLVAARKESRLTDPSLMLSCVCRK
jgi:hypothetical protein